LQHGQRDQRGEHLLKAKPKFRSGFREMPFYFRLAPSVRLSQFFFDGLTNIVLNPDKFPARRSLVIAERRRDILEFQVVKIVENYYQSVLIR
jgi:hypothetical protein